MKKLSLFAFALMFFVAAGCEDNPVQTLIMNNVNNSDPSQWTTVWMIYSDGDNMSKGPADFPTYTDYWGTRPEQITLEYRFQNPGRDGYMGHQRAAYMHWDGSASVPYDPPGPAQSNWVGWGLQADGAKNISPAGYTKLKFAAKGVIRADVVLRIELAGTNNGTAASLNGSTGVIQIYPAGTPGQLTISNDAWTEYSVDIQVQTGVLDLIKVILKNTAEPNPRNGATIWLDNIRFE